MGLIGALVGLPLAPVKGMVWVAERIAEQADHELFDENKIRGQLLELQIALEDGVISEGEYDEAEEILLDRLRISRQRRKAGELQQLPQGTEIQI